MYNLTEEQVEKYLSSMAEKGYIKVGIIHKKASLDVLMIHKDWTTFDFAKNFTQAWKDLPSEIKQGNIVSIECPTLEMYEKERTRGPKHKILVDRKPSMVAVRNVPYWTREGYFYVSRLTWYRGPYKATTTRKLGFFTYHFIRWIHGDAKMKEMAVKIPNTRLDTLPWEPRNDSF